MVDRAEAGTLLHKLKTFLSNPEDFVGKRTGLLLALLVGFTSGLGIYTFYYAEGFSYMSSDPKVCDNCHIMNLQYDSWQKSGHHHSAVCADCHLPHSFPGKYIAKAENGYHHSRGFTFQDFHEPIMIKKRNSEILQDNCVRCHADLVAFMRPEAGGAGMGVDCVHCHSSVGHGPRAGLGGGYKKNRKGEIIP